MQNRSEYLKKNCRSNIVVTQVLV